MAEIPPTRASLLVRLRDARDEAAWNQFVELYAPLVYGYARRQGLQDADAADLCQEVLRAVAGAVSHFEYDPGRGLFRNWLFTVVRRKLSDWRRRQRQESTNTDRVLDQQPASEAPEPEWAVAWEQRLFGWACAEVRREVTDNTWQAFWRSAIDEQAGKQVATELGMTIAAVYHACSRVRARLKELIQSVQEE